VASANALMKAVGSKLGINIIARYDTAHERWQLRLEKILHGNLKLGVIDEDLLVSGDYAQLRKTADILAGLFGPGAFVVRGDKKKAVNSFAETMQWLLSEVERSVTKQRYKGLGEMNPAQLWETTMDPKVRRLLKVQIEDAIGADEIFSTLMGELVEPRRSFIETNALAARNIDV
jgi:DNA gyrase subunit B